MQKTKNSAIVLMILCTILTSTAQIFYKLGSTKLSFNILSIITNWQIIFGLCLYALGAIIMIKALSMGEVTILYPIIATSYIWVSILSSIIFLEKINLIRWFGIIFIVLGVILISFGSKEKKSAIEYVEAL